MFLKCGLCGFYNEIKSKDLCKCENCKQTIPNNYHDWLKNNPGQSFGYYKLNVCSKTGFEKTPEIRKKTRKAGLNLIYPVIVVLFFVFGYSIFNKIGFKSGYMIFDLFNFGKTSEKILEKQWISKEYGDSCIFIDTPFELNVTEIELPENIKEFITNFQSFSYEKKFTIMLNCTEYLPEIEADLAGAASGSMSEIELQPGVSKMLYSEKTIEKSSLTGIQYDGKFDFNKIPTVFSNIIFVKENKLWNLFTGYRENDNIAKKIIDWVLESVEIEHDLRQNI